HRVVFRVAEEGRDEHLTAGVTLRWLAADDLGCEEFPGAMLDQHDSAVRRHVRVFPTAGHVRPHRDHYAAVAYHYHVVIDETCDQFIENRSDPVPHVFVGFTARRDPGPRPRMIIAFGLENRFIRLAGELAGFPLMQALADLKRQLQLLSND